jgi:flotillin
MMPSIFVLGTIAVFAILMIVTFLGLVKRYKRCPSDQILVVYGKVGANAAGNKQTAKCIHGGAAFVWPIIQDFHFLPLAPMQIKIDLKGALSKQNIRVDVPAMFTVGISTKPEIMQNAAERMLGLGVQHIEKMAEDIIMGQLRFVIAQMNIEEINTDREKFYSNISKNVETEIEKIGMNLINTNIMDIKDAAGYIDALGKEAAAKAINDAKVSVAEKTRDGEIGKANAEKDQNVRLAETSKEKEIGVANATRDQEIAVADATRETRIKTAEADAKAKAGEFQAKASVADSESQYRQKASEAKKKAEVAEKVNQANSEKESYEAQKQAELARADKERATLTASQIVTAEIAKQKLEIESAAQAEKVRLIAQGDADAVKAKALAEADGIFAVLSKQAEGFDKMMKAAGNDPKMAVQMMIVEKLPQLMQIQTDAIKNIKIDKVTVWDSGGKDGDIGSTANFLRGMVGAIPPMDALMKQAGLSLPDWLATQGQKELPPVAKTEEKK